MTKFMLMIIVKEKCVTYAFRFQKMLGFILSKPLAEEWTDSDEGMERNGFASNMECSVKLRVKVLSGQFPG